MDFNTVGAPQGAGYGGGLMDFSMLSGQPKQQQQPQPGQPGQPNQQQNPAYSLGQGIGQWLRQYFAQQQGQDQGGVPQPGMGSGPMAGAPPVVGPGGPQGLY